MVTTKGTWENMCFCDEVGLTLSVQLKVQVSSVQLCLLRVVVLPEGSMCYSLKQRGTNTRLFLLGTLSAVTGALQCMHKLLLLNLERGDVQ